MSISSARISIVQRADSSGRAGPLLRSPDNPDGWRLVDVLAQLRGELSRQLLALDGRNERSGQVLNQYQRIVSILHEAEGRLRTLPDPETWAGPPPHP